MYEEQELEEAGEVYGWREEAECEVRRGEERGGTEMTEETEKTVNESTGLRQLSYQASICY